MRHLISTLQTHNQQMKGEVVKYKIRLRETQTELNQVGPKEKKEKLLQSEEEIKQLWVTLLATHVISDGCSEAQHSRTSR